MSCRLDHDCIRDIMLFIEENTTYKNTFIDMQDIIVGLKDKYNEDCVDYHCRLIDSAGFISSSLYLDGTGEFSGFSWDGHQYLDNIRDPKAWDMLKNGTIGLSSMSLEVVRDLAKELILAWGKNKLGLNK